MTFEEGKYIAQIVVAKLAPVTEQIRVCGSLRRLKRTLSDIDIVVEPKRTPVKDMFGNVTGHEVDPKFIEIVNSWEKIKGEPTGKYCQRIVKGEKVEISIATKENFGCIQLIRIGDADFSHMIMKRVRKMGLEQRDGFLYDGDMMIPVYEESEYFKVLGLPYIEPPDRNKDSFKNLKR